MIQKRTSENECWAYETKYNNYNRHIDNIYVINEDGENTEQHYTIDTIKKQECVMWAIRS